MRKTFKRILKGLLLLFGLLILAIVIMIASGNPIPEGTDAIIDELVEKGPSNLYAGESGYAMNGEVAIWYESIGDTADPAVLLIMGHSTTSLLWPPYFYQALVDSGYHVIRYDNRGLGKSDHIEDWSLSNAYDLDDMTEDAIAVLDTLGIEKAHIIGASMGGMIALRLGFDYPERVLSLVPMMTTGYMMDPKLPRTYFSTMLGFARLIPRARFPMNERNHMKFVLGSVQIMNHCSSLTFDPAGPLEVALFEMREHSPPNEQVVRQHSVAVRKSGSCYERLDDIGAPVLIIHGTADPMVPVEHGKKLAELMPEAELLLVEDMGHIFPESRNKVLIEAIDGHFK